MHQSESCGYQTDRGYAAVEVIRMRGRRWASGGSRCLWRGSAEDRTTVPSRYDSVKQESLPVRVGSQYHSPRLSIQSDLILLTRNQLFTMFG